MLDEGNEFAKYPDLPTKTPNLLVASTTLMSWMGISLSPEVSLPCLHGCDHFQACPWESLLQGYLT